MATILSTLAVLAAAPALSDKLVNGDDANGKLTIATAIVDIGASLAADDILTIIPDQFIPDGAIVVPQLCSVTCANPGTTLTLDIGDADDVDRYADGIVLSAGGQIGFASGTIPAGTLVPYRLPVGKGISAIVKSAASISADGKLVFLIAYRSK